MSLLSLTSRQWQLVHRLALKDSSSFAHSKLLFDADVPDVKTGTSRDKRGVLRSECRNFPGGIQMREPLNYHINILLYDGPHRVTL